MLPCSTQGTHFPSNETMKVSAFSMSLTCTWILSQRHPLFASVLGWRRLYYLQIKENKGKLSIMEKSINYNLFWIYLFTDNKVMPSVRLDLLLSPHIRHSDVPSFPFRNVKNLQSIYSIFKFCYWLCTVTVVDPVFQCVVSFGPVGVIREFSFPFHEEWSCGENCGFHGVEFVVCIQRAKKCEFI